MHDRDKEIEGERPDAPRVGNRPGGENQPSGETKPEQPENEPH